MSKRNGRDKSKKDERDKSKKDKRDKTIDDLIRLYENRPPGSDYIIEASKEFIDDYDKLLKKNPDQRVKSRIERAIKKLWYRKYWSPQKGSSDHSTKVVQYGDGNAYVMRINKRERLIFHYITDRGPVPVIYLGGLILDHDKQERKLKEMLGRDELPPAIEVLEEPEPDDNTTGEVKGTTPRIVPYSKVGDYCGLDLNDAQKWLESSANIIPTREQLTALVKEPPILIEGQAGTGKTSLITLAIAASINRFEKENKTILCTCYSSNVLELILEGVKASLLYVQKKKHGIPARVDFILFQQVLYDMLPQTLQEKYEIPSGQTLKRRVTFPTFSRRFFPTLSKKSKLRNEMPAELAWHLIRSVLKGQQIQHSRFKISDVPKKGVPKDSGLRRKDFQNLHDGQIKLLFYVYEEYEKWLSKRQMYDDIDLAHDAWMYLREREHPKYDLVLLDEAQDLTLLEYRILTKLQHEPEAKAKLIVAGDPLQTINPTGFDWGLIRSFFYDKKSHEAAEVLTLEKNFRTPEPIVNVSNFIQELRSHYYGSAPKIQSAHKKIGSKPICLQITEDDREALRKVIAGCPANTAIIVWSRDEAEIRELLETDEDYKPVWSEIDDKKHYSEELMLFNITTIKGLEFEKVILYKFASHPKFTELQDYILEKKKMGKDSPHRAAVLYHLNRLFISVTRSVKELYIVDESKAFDNFWNDNQWNKLLDHSKKDNTKMILGTEFFEGDLLDSAKNYRKWYDKDRDVTLLNYAIQHCRRAESGIEQRTLLIELKALRYEHDAAEEEMGSTDRTTLLVKAAEQYSKIDRVAKAAELYFDAGMWEQTGDILREHQGKSYTLSAKHFLMLTMSDIRVQKDNEELMDILNNQINHWDGNSEKIRDELSRVSGIQNLYDGLMSEFITEIANRKLWGELKKLLGEILWESSINNHECPKLLCRYLIEGKEYLICKTFIEENKLHIDPQKKDLSNQYVVCLENEVKNFRLIINPKSEFSSEIERLEVKRTIHDEIEDRTDGTKSTIHKRCKGLVSLGIAVYKELLYEKEHGMILAGDFRESREKLQDVSYFDPWNDGLKELDGFEPISDDDDEDPGKRLINLKSIYIARGWTSINQSLFRQAIDYFSNSSDIVARVHLDKISEGYLKDLNNSIANYGQKRIHELVWTLQSQVNIKELSSSKNTVSAIINSGKDPKRSSLVQERMLSLALGNQGGKGTSRARSWLIEVLAKRAAKDKKTAAKYVDVLFSNKSWKKAKSFSRSSPKMLPEMKRFEIDARHLEHHVIKGNIMKASSTRLRKLASLYEKAKMLGDVQRVRDAIPKDPVYDIEVLIIDTQTDWAAKLDGINTVFESVDRKTIVSAWSAVKKAIANHQIDALAGMTDANRGKIGWRRLLEAHDNNLRKLLGKSIPNGAILLEYVCPYPDIRMKWISGVHRHFAPKILVPIVLRHCGRLARDIQSYQERYESCDELGAIAGELVNSNIRDNRKLNTIKKVPRRKVDDVILQLIQMSQGLSLRGRTGKELGSILEQAGQKKSGKKQEQILRILEHRFGKPGGGRVLDALEMALPDIIRR